MSAKYAPVELETKLPLLEVTATRTFKGLRPIRATQEQAEVLGFALNAYGFLLTSQPPQAYSFTEFASIIESHYDATTPQTAAVIKTLHTIQEQSLATVH